MALQLQTRSTVPAANRLQAEPTALSPGPAAVAATRVGRAGAILGGLGLASSVFVIFRLVATWRVAPRAASHAVSILGEKLSYPAVNLAAVVVVALAALGLAVVARTFAGAVREVLASRRLRRRLLAHEPRELDDVLVIIDEHPRAFCAGLLTPRVYVSTGAVALLDELALEAVLAHERHHARRRDPLRLATGRVIAAALFCVPGIPDLVRRQCSLVELGADESAINLGPEHRSALARAMLSFSERSHSGDPTGIEPERVDHLLGEAPSWRFPFLVCLFAGSVLALLAAVGVLAGQVASGSSTLAPPLLSRQPCVMVLAAIPALAGLIALALRRRGRAITDPQGS
jgi:hypothetical protein